MIIKKTEKIIKKYYNSLGKKRTVNQMVSIVITFKVKTWWLFIIPIYTTESIEKIDK